VTLINSSDSNGQVWKIVETVWLPALLALLSSVFLGYVFNVWPGTTVRVAVPTVFGKVIGPAQVVFDTRNGCEQIDIPDAPARAFRDDHGIVHLIATHYVARAMIGPSLDQMSHNCHVIYTSPQDPDPSHFQDNNWLYSFYTTDGRRIVALVHSEYDADEIPGMCATPKDTNNCWWNTVTFAESFDGGYSFRVPAPPRNLVAALPYRYVVGNPSGAYGYSEPTNIVKIKGSYYALINEWAYKAQKRGACLIRTSDVFDPQSWRAWDSKDFTIRFVDPYRETVASSEDHVCAPVLGEGAQSLSRHEPSGNFIVMEFLNDDGFYMQASQDLKHWSSPTLLVKLSDLRAADGPGNWTYGYLSLLDPASTDRNFSTISNTPYVYYVRTDPDHPPGRVLFRRSIKLQFGR
jgi:hypothetical protein